MDGGCTLCRGRRRCKFRNFFTADAASRGPADAAAHFLLRRPSGGPTVRHAMMWKRCRVSRGDNHSRSRSRRPVLSCPVRPRRPGPRRRPQSPSSAKSHDSVSDGTQQQQRSATVAEKRVGRRNNNRSPSTEEIVSNGGPPIATATASSTVVNEGGGRRKR